MQEEETRRGGLIEPSEWRKIIPYEPEAASELRGWVGLEAACFHGSPATEFNQPALTHHMLVLFVRPPDELDLLYEGVMRRVPPPAGTISLVPAGSPAQVRTSGCMDQLHTFLEPGLVGRVAAEAFGLDSARLTVPPLDGLNLPHLRAAMEAVNAELTASGAGGPLVAESLANVLAVQLIRHLSTPSRPERGRDGALPRARLRAVVEYIAAVARLSAYYFARQFKQATGVPPYQYVIKRRVERAKQLLQAGSDPSLAEVAADAGFCDQSQFSYHFKRLVGVTPGQFLKFARIAQKTASRSKKRDSAPLRIQSGSGQESLELR
jgi:AraC family transcriptional regulator